ncbi:peptidylprolyl isomerase [Cytophaga hutchinsonii]|uniref:Peptidyl-prolyl cis-trans isomerase C (Rotamase C) n=1 Tax=Cytophaga hutchinsonii (strain ATCC 33406 / DSM 1761 / CIP 103989 / NBRC 15051 / NCIMB 9469 / D465) TaxID=269798 RepID=A0A6N4SV24_CYTH3|nr:peptidylprolyl isomerase [Cytophaga hutchinsonii]ABG60324.1 peptidyl-prolyl cis-trans isomerase C (rotamase C) [Cytophaga hutchinsonii ATCC 33406]SFX98942.1 peptidylprolyl isomerase [Cytophaga hutchinsonii ATCC 33406]
MKLLLPFFIVFILATGCAKVATEHPCPAVEASHILTPAESPEQFENAQDTAEVIIAKLKNGESFSDLALQYGSDGTKTQGGNLGWFTRGMMVQPFEDSCYNATINKPLIVKTQFGVHVVKVTGKKDIPCN